MSACGCNEGNFNSSFCIYAYDALYLNVLSLLTLSNELILKKKTSKLNLSVNICLTFFIRVIVKKVSRSISLIINTFYV